jgi:hypothetical protein
MFDDGESILVRPWPNTIGPVLLLVGVIVGQYHCWSNAIVGRCNYWQYHWVVKITGLTVCWNDIIVEQTRCCCLFQSARVSNIVAERQGCWELRHYAWPNNMLGHFAAYNKNGDVVWTTVAKCTGETHSLRIRFA